MTHATGPSGNRGGVAGTEDTMTVAVPRPKGANALRADFPILATTVHGKPLIYGANKDKGIKLAGFHPAIVHLNEDGNSANDLFCLGAPLAMAPRSCSPRFIDL